MTVIYHDDPTRLPYPGTCANCGDSSQPCLDMGVTREWDGAVLLCVSCIKFTIEQYNVGIRIERYNQLEEKYQKALDERVHISAVLESLRETVSNAVNSFDNDLSDYFNNGPWSDRSTVSEKSEGSQPFNSWTLDGAE